MAEILQTKRRARVDLRRQGKEVVLIQPLLVVEAEARHQDQTNKIGTQYSLPLKGHIVCYLKLAREKKENALKQETEPRPIYSSNSCSLSTS